VLPPCSEMIELVIPLFVFATPVEKSWVRGPQCVRGKTSKVADGLGRLVVI